MSKVIHLSDNAHNAAKNFCKQHGLKMSDWVADLVADAIQNNRVDPRTAPRPTPPAPVQTQAPQASSGPPKKRLEQINERPAPSSGVIASEVPPWAAPPFWASASGKK